MFAVGTVVDLFDTTFDQWRGSYVIAKDYGDGKVQIRNQRTNSKQTVSASRLRIGRLPDFKIKGLQP
jgi:hypothetical protein